MSHPKGWRSAVYYSNIMWPNSHSPTNSQDLINGISCCDESSSC